MIKEKFILLLFAIVILVACGMRDTSTPEKALLGHWLTEDGKTHYYFNPGKLVMVNNGRRMDQSYVVLESNNRENWIKIRVKTGYDIGHDKKLLFGNDRRSLTCTVEIENVAINTKCNFIDGKKEP